MKKVLKLIGLIALIAVIGLSMAACDDDPPLGYNPGGSNPGGSNPGGTNPGGSNPGGGKTITITGLPTGTTFVSISVQEVNGKNINVVAVKSMERNISNNSVTFSLLAYPEYEGNPWTGSGSYFLELLGGTNTGDGFTGYYTDGKSYVELGMKDYPTSHMIYYDKLPRYNITSASSTIPYSKFVHYDGEPYNGR
jgi:hypothetical protein